MNRSLLIVVSLLSAGLGLVGCGAGGGPSGGDQLKAVDVNAKPREQVRDGGTLRLAVGELPPNFNAGHVDGALADLSEIMGPMMPGLFRSDERGNLTPDPDYLISAAVTATKPRQVVAYRLNPKARWTDGKPITWREFEAEWKAFRSAAGEYQIRSSTGYERVASVKRGRDDHEVIVTFARPYAEWQGLFSVYPVETNSSPRAFNTGWKDRIVKTAGPFKLEKIDQTAQTVTIVRDPKWWGTRPKLDRIIFRALDNEAQINAFASGEIDAVGVGPQPADYQRVQRVPGADVRQAASPDLRHFTFNAESPALRDVKVRKAIAMAIDRQTIARSDLTGLNWPPRILDNHFLVNTQAGYRSNSGEVGRFSPGQARLLLDQAGWRLPAGAQFRRKGGKELALRFVIPSQVTVSRQEGLLAQRMLRDVGVKLDLQTVPENEFFEKYVTPGNFDITPFSWIGGVLPVSGSVAIYEKPVRKPNGELAIQQNYARVGSDRIDELLNQAQEQLDPTQVRNTINQADTLIWELVHSITLYQRPQIVAAKENLANYGASGFKSTPIEDVGFVK